MATTEVTYTKAGADAKLATKADLPAGGTDGQALIKSGSTTAWATVSGGTGGPVADATTTAKGVVQLAGDLTGTAAAPALQSVLGLSGTVGTSTQIPVLSYDAKGRITAISSVAAAASSGGSAYSGITDLRTYLPNGYVTDGSADYTAPFTSALAAADTLYIPRGTWLLTTSAVTIPNTVRKIILDPDAIVQTNLVGAQPWTRTGSANSSPTAITAGATAGSVSITVASTAGISPGTWLYITSDNTIPNSTTLIAFLRRVDAVTGSVLTLDTPIFRTMTTSPRVYVVTLAPRLTLEGGSWQHINPTAVTGTRPLWLFQLSQGPVTEDVNFEKNGGPGLQVSNSVGGVARNTRFFDLLNDPTNNHFGYGLVWVGATRDHVWESGVAARIRHAVTTGAAPVPISAISPTTQRGEPDSCKVLSGVTAMDTVDAGFDSHEAGFNIQFNGPTAINTGIGAQARSDSAFIDVVAVGSTLFGVQVTSAATNATIAVQMKNPSPSPSGGAYAIRNSGAGTRIRTSNMVNPPSGWGAIRSDTDYVLVGAGRLDGARFGVGIPHYAGLDFITDTVDPAGGGGTSLPALISTNSQSGTAYTLALTDAFVNVEYTGTGVLQITVPNSTTVPFLIGTVIELNNYSTGSITLVPDAGVSIRTPSGLRLASQYASAALRKRANNEWILSGLTVV